MTVDFTRLVRPGDMVTWTQGAGEPTGLIADLMEQRHAIGPFRVFLAGSYAGSVRPEHADVVSIAGLGAVGTNRARNNSPVSPSIAAATTDLACTSNPTLVRSANTGASSHMWIGRTRGISPGNPRGCVGEAPARNRSDQAVTSYRLVPIPVT